VDIVETSVFTRVVTRLLTDDEYRELQWALAANPEMGTKIPGSGGIRKLRWARRHQGKSGGFRIIYYWFNLEGKLLMLYMYPKNVQDDLSNDQLKILRRIVESEE
jgi:hypothetical protein